MTKLSTINTVLSSSNPTLLNVNGKRDEVICTGISIDTRTLKPGELYIAIRGTRLDGHDYLNEAISKGACAAIVDHVIETNIPLIVVPDTTHALGTLAQAWRRQFHLPVVALTGSCGKTTTKAILAHILEQVGPTLSTQGTLNNEIGAPLTLLKLTSEHQFAVIELGANHPKEIAYTAALTQPQIALITNIAPVHLEGFGSLEGVAQAKGEIYAALPKDGMALLNHDDAFFSQFKAQTEHHKTFTFGLTADSTISAHDIKNTAEGFPTFTLQYHNESCSITLPLLGQHNVMNALAAACAAYALNIPLALVKTGLESVTAVNKRMNKYHAFNGAVLIDDTYNANPTAFLAAIDFLTQQTGEKVLVVGDMGELGPDAIYYHEQLGQQAKAKGIQHLYAVGKLSAHAAQAFGTHGEHFSDKSQLIAHLRKAVTPEQVVLVKGSRSAKMEEVVEGLKK